MSKEVSLIEGLLGEVSNLKVLGKKSQKAASKLLSDNEDNGCIGVAVIMVGKVGSSCAISSKKPKITDKDLVRMIKDQIKSFEEDLKENDDDEEGNEEVDKLFDKLQKATDKLDKKVLTKVMTEAALNTVMAGATALDGLKKVNEAAGNVLTDSELEILDKSLRKKHEEEQDDEDDED